MRIALLPSAYAPAVGGVEVLTHRLATHLIAAGDDVEVWTIRHPRELPKDEEVAGIPVRRFEFPLPPARPWPLVRSPVDAARGAGALMRTIREFGPDLLHVQCFSNNGVYAALAAAVGQRPLVVSLQGETVMDDHDIYDRSLLLRTGLRVGLRRAAAVTACSRFVMADAVARFGLAPAAGRVIFNGVDGVDAIPPVAVELPFRRYVLGVGRVVAKKGFDLLIDAWACVAERFRGVGLVVAGGGSELDRLRELAETRGVAGAVHLTGPVEQDQVAWLMRHADVFVLPSRVEPFGIVVLEAMLAGRAVVVSRRGGAPEIVTHGRDGLVVDPLDTAALAGAIALLLDDADMRARLGSAGSDRAAHFDWSRITAEYQSVYRSVVSA